MKHRLTLITTYIALLLIIISSLACDNPILESRVPQNFPGSRWESDDGSITFTCFQSDENIRFAIGQIVIEEEVINFPIFWTLDKKSMLVTLKCRVTLPFYLS